MHTLEQKGVGRMEEQARLVGITSNREITKEADPEFWFQFQRSILLALRDNGTLDEMQYRYAEEKLKDQLRTFVKKKNLCDNQSERREAP